MRNPVGVSRFEAATVELYFKFLIIVSRHGRIRPTLLKSVRVWLQYR